MAEKMDLSSSKVQARQRQLATYGTQTPLSSTAVDRGSTRWLNGSYVEVSGTLTGDGTFDWSGSFAQSGETTFSGEVNLVGPVTIAGDTTMSGRLTQNGPSHLNGATDIAGDLTSTGNFTVNGPTDLNGAIDITGDVTATGNFNVNGPMKTTGSLSVEGALDIKGPSTLSSNLTVAAGKKVTLGGLTLENTGAGGGTVNFPNGSVSSGPLGMLLVSSIRIEIGAPEIKLSSLPTTTQPANLYVDGTGKVFRCI